MKKVCTSFLATLSLALLSGTALAASSPTMPSMAPSAGGKAASTAILPPSEHGKLEAPIPSGIIGVPAQPLSSEKMPVDGQHIDGQIQKAIQQADDRLADVHIGSGDMKVAPLPDATLQSDINAEARLHEMNLKMQEVIMASKLWGSAYDGKREMALDKPVTQPGVGTPGMPNAPSPEEKEIERKRQAEEEKQEALEAQIEAQKKVAERKKLLREQMAIQKRNMGNVPPVVSSIYGPVINPRATLLIPYVGTQNVSKGDSFTLIDGTSMAITSISPDGVYASHNGAKPRLLGFGSSVPTQSDAIRSLHRVVDAIEGHDNDTKNAAPPAPSGPPKFGTTTTIPSRGN